MTEIQDVFNFLKSYGPQLTLLGTMAAFVFGAFKFFHERRETHHWKQFEAFHKLVRELVEPVSQEQPLYLDRQCAVVYELRHFKRYYPYSLRMLKRLREKWCNTDTVGPLIAEMDLAIAFIQSQVRTTRGDS
jgi:hypothetical protein